MPNLNKAILEGVTDDQEDLDITKESFEFPVSDAESTLTALSVSTVASDYSQDPELQQLLVDLLEKSSPSSRSFSSGDISSMENDPDRVNLYVAIENWMRRAKKTGKLPDNDDSGAECNDVDLKEVHEAIDTWKQNMENSRDENDQSMSFSEMLEQFPKHIVTSYWDSVFRNYTSDEDSSPSTSADSTLNESSISEASSLTTTSESTSGISTSESATDTSTTESVTDTSSTDTSITSESVKEISVSETPTYVQFNSDIYGSAFYKTPSSSELNKRFTESSFLDATASFVSPEESEKESGVDSFIEASWTMDCRKKLSMPSHADTSEASPECNDNNQNGLRLSEFDCTCQHPSLVTDTPSPQIHHGLVQNERDDSVEQESQSDTNSEPEGAAAHSDSLQEIIAGYKDEMTEELRRACEESLAIHEEEEVTEMAEMLKVQLALLNAVVEDLEAPEQDRQLMYGVPYSVRRQENDENLYVLTPGIDEEPILDDSVILGYLVTTFQQE